MCFEVGVRELVVGGYICPLKAKRGKGTIDTSTLHVRAGEFVASEIEGLVNDDGTLRDACIDLVNRSHDRQATLIFAASVEHARNVQRVLKADHNIECQLVSGDTPALERATILDAFKTGQLKYLVNVNVLTTGFDAPIIDCVALMRPTLSPGLYYQMVGRGFRLHPGKDHCLVLDYGENIIRHGPVDAIVVKKKRKGTGEAPAKECPQCNELVHAAYAVCPECGHAFPPRQHTRHTTQADDSAILSDEESQEEDEVWTEHVSDVSYHVHYKRNDPTGTAPPTMRVEYRCGFNTWHKEWVCFEHHPGSYAQRKAAQWWQMRSREPVPAMVQLAVEWAEAGALRTPKTITLSKKAGDPWVRVIGAEFNTPKPPRLESPDDIPMFTKNTIDKEDDPFAGFDYDEDDIPF